MSSPVAATSSLRRCSCKAKAMVNFVKDGWRQDAALKKAHTRMVLSIIQCLQHLMKPSNVTIIVHHMLAILLIKKTHSKQQTSVTSLQDTS